MQLSIIIPVYNTWSNLLKNLKLLKIDKNFFKFEVIIVDDRSFIIPKKIIKKFKLYKNIKIIFLSKNRGPGYARNIGLKKAAGKYIWFVDSDDLLDKNWQLNFHNFLKNQKYSDVVVFKTNINKNKHISVENYFHKNDPYKSMPVESALKNNLKYLDNFNSTVWSFWFKKNIIKKNKIYFNNIAHYEDNIFVSKFFFYASNIIKIPKVCYIHCRRNNSVSSYHNILKLKKNFVINEILIALYETFILIQKSHNKKKKYLQKYFAMKVSRIICEFASYYLIYNLTKSKNFNQQLKINWKNVVQKFKKKINNKFNVVQNLNDFLLFVSNSEDLLFEKYFSRYDDKVLSKSKTFAVHCYSTYSIAWAKILERKNLKFQGFIDVFENGFKDYYTNKKVHKNFNSINKKIDNIFIINRRKKICNKIKKSYKAEGFNEKNIFSINYS